MSATAQQGISQRRANAVADEACEVITGLDALAKVGGWHHGDSVPAVEVRWFCAVLQGGLDRILQYLDTCQPEPPAPPVAGELRGRMAS